MLRVWLQQELGKAKADEQGSALRHVPVYQPADGPCPVVSRPLHCPVVSRPLTCAVQVPTLLFLCRHSSPHRL